MVDQKMKWIRQLKVGDLVCDCRYKHVRIKELRPLRMTWMPWIIRQFIFAKWLPKWMTNALDVVWEKVANFFKLKSFYDYNVTLEDDYGCSAFDCLGPVDHEHDAHPVTS